MALPSSWLILLLSATTLSDSWEADGRLQVLLSVECPTLSSAPEILVPSRGIAPRDGETRFVPAQVDSPRAPARLEPPSLAPGILRFLGLRHPG